MIVDRERTTAPFDLRLEDRAVQRQPLAARGEQRLMPATRGLVEEHAELRDERFVADLEPHHAAPVVHPQHRREHGHDAIPVVRRPTARQPRHRSRRGVGEARRRGFLRPRAGAVGELVEAGERLDVALGIECLAVDDQPVGAEDTEEKEWRLEDTTAAAVGSGGGPAQQDRAGLEAEDVINAGRDVGGELQ